MQKNLHFCFAGAQHGGLEADFILHPLIHSAGFQSGTKCGGYFKSAKVWIKLCNMNFQYMTAYSRFFPRSISSVFLEEQVDALFNQFVCRAIKVDC